MAARDIQETPGPNGDDRVTLALVVQEVRALRKDVQILNDRLDSHYVTQAEFWPVKTIVYGGAALILVAALTAVLTLVIRGNPGHAKADEPTTTSGILRTQVSYP